MTDKTITELPAITSYGDAAVIPMDSGVQTFKCTKAELAQGLQKWTAFYHAVCGSAAYCTHANLAAALADSLLTTGVRVLLTENQTLASSVAASKAKWLIEGLPGVTLTAGVATVGIAVTAASVTIRGLRFVGFATGISFSSAADYGRVQNCNFNTCTTEVDDTLATAGRLPMQTGNLTE
jgi:hypothetical protein